MLARPKFEIPTGRIDSNIDRLGLFLLLLLWAVAVYVFLNSPDIIPIHFNFSGEADRYGARWTIFILPLLANIIFAGFSYLHRNPQILNYPVKINAANASKQYMIASRMLRFVKLSIIIIFLVIIIVAHLNTIQLVNGLGAWFLPFVLAIILIPVIVGLMQSFKKSNL